MHVIEHVFLDEKIYIYSIIYIFFQRCASRNQLESKKVNAACAMDRVEFLASTRNRFTEFRASEANEMRWKPLGVG